MTRSSALAALLISSAALTACERPAQTAAPQPSQGSTAAVAEAAPTPAPSAAPPTASAPVAEEQASDDWRRYATPADADRISRLDAAWAAGLKGAGAEVDALGALAKPGGGLTPRAQPGPGQYRCRTIKLGGEQGGLAFVAYPYFKCEVEVTPGGDLIVRKLNGSQRFEGKLYPDRDDRLVYLGAAALGSGETPPAYGANRERDQAGVLERIGPQRWRLALPWPLVESNLDIIELVK